MTRVCVGHSRRRVLSILPIEEAVVLAKELARLNYLPKQVNEELILVGQYEVYLLVPLFEPCKDMLVKSWSKSFLDSVEIVEEEDVDERVKIVNRVRELVKSRDFPEFVRQWVDSILGDSDEKVLDAFLPLRVLVKVLLFTIVDLRQQLRPLLERKILRFYIFLILGKVFKFDKQIT